MKKNSLNYLINLIQIILFFFVGIIGIIIFPNFLNIFGLNINDYPKVALYKYHHWLGLILIIITFIHIGRYWKIFLNSSKKFISRLKEIRKIKLKKIDIIMFLNILLILSIILVFITGILKFPGFLQFFGINPLNISLNLITLIHDYFGLITFILSILHILFYIKNFLKKTKSIIYSIEF